MHCEAKKELATSLLRTEVCDIYVVAQTVDQLPTPICDICVVLLMEFKLLIK